MESVRRWMEDEKRSYLQDCDNDPWQALDYMVEDANGECETELDDEELRELAREVLGLE